ncbi:MAG: 2,5-diamino-6-(ribosylamino)-4(3H)-pyrimidinone 5'-phosphate reductase [Halodesulfurarchaeum sp.]
MDVVVNAAMSVDGKLAARDREQLTISGPSDFARVDELRSKVDAIMVGVGTVLADDPSLTLDEPGDAETPVRIVADSTARTPPDARVLDDQAETVVLVSEAVPPEHRGALKTAGATIIEAGTKQVDLAGAFESLEARGIEAVLVEGGGELIFSLFEAGLIEELSVFVGPLIIGGRDAPTLADGVGFTDEYPELDLKAVSQIDDGVLLEFDVLDQ